MTVTHLDVAAGAASAGADEPIPSFADVAWQGAVDVAPADPAAGWSHGANG